MDVSPSGRHVATGDIDGQVKIYDIASKQAVGDPLNNHGRSVKCVAFSADGSQVLSGSEDQHMHMVDVQTQKRTLTLVNHAHWITSVSFNPADPNYFVSSSLDKTVKIWKNGYNKEVKTIELND